MGRKNMKNIRILLNALMVIVAILMVLSLWGSVIVVGEHGDQQRAISVRYSFETPVIQKITIDDTVYDHVVLPGSLGDGDPGEPCLPMRGAYILLPQGKTVHEIKVNPGELRHLGSNFMVEPMGMNAPLSSVDSAPLPAPDKTIYESNEMFPGELFSEIGTYRFRGYEILVLTLCPVQYVPATGDLYYYQDITVNVDTMEEQTNNPLYRGLQKDKQEVLTKVDNPEVAETYSTPMLSQGDHDFLIITTDALKAAFVPLQEAHNADGVNTVIKTLSEIIPEHEAITTEDIRGFIQNVYLNDGIEYILLGGDADVVPARKLWVKAWTGGSTAIMPSDLYYGCLDGSFNSDGDDYWGEPTDGLNGSDVDLLAEVYVGRACVGNEHEVANFVEKTLAYMETMNIPQEKKVLMVGEHLWDDPDTFGGDYMDELIDGSKHNFYTTVGIPSDGYVITKLYDQDWPDYHWPKTEIIDHITNEFHLINHLGHSSYGYNMRMDNDDVDNLNNTESCFIYSQGCNAGGFDDPKGYDSISEHFTVKTTHGAFAGIWNARSGWGVTGSTNGASQRFHRQFWDAVFGEEILIIGKANQDSKEDNIYRIKSSCMRWCYYQLNLFGDPTLMFYPNENLPPDKPDKPKIIPRIGGIGERHLGTQSNDPDEDQVYYKWSWDDGNISEWLGPYESGEAVIISYNWTIRGTYEVKVKARDTHRGESKWSDPLQIKIVLTKERSINPILFNLLQRFLFLAQLLKL